MNHSPEVTKRTKLETVRIYRMMATNHFREENQGATAYLNVRNAKAAIEFYQKVFGATEVLRLVMADGRAGHADIKSERFDDGSRRVSRDGTGEPACTG